MSILMVIMSLMIIGVVAINVNAYIPRKQHIPRHSHMYVQMTYEFVA